MYTLDWLARRKPCCMPPPQSPLHAVRDGLERRVADGLGVHRVAQLGVVHVHLLHKAIKAVEE